MRFKLPIIENEKMPAEKMPQEPLKLSPYQEAGSPTSCFLPGCGKAFDGSCFHGDDGHYYCSEVCANEGIDPAHVIVPIRRARS